MAKRPSFYDFEAMKSRIAKNAIRTPVLHDLSARGSGVPEKRLSQAAAKGKRKEPERLAQQEVAKHLRKRQILFCASAGGMRTSMLQAKKMKAMGYQKGFPDLFICEPRGQYHGMFVEMKSTVGVQSAEQKAWQKELEKRGYLYVTKRSAGDAIESIEGYLRL